MRLRKLQRDRARLEGLRVLRDADPLQVPLSGIEVPPLLADLRRVYAEEQRRLPSFGSATKIAIRSSSSKRPRSSRSARAQSVRSVPRSTPRMRASESERDEKKVQAELLAEAGGLRISRLEIEYNRCGATRRAFR